MDNCLYLGLRKAPSKSSIAYQNAHRSWKVFRSIYYMLWRTLGQHLGGWHKLPKIDKKIKLIDSSTITLCLKAFPWAAYTHEKRALKLHTLLDLEMDMHGYMLVSNGKVADCKAAMHIPVSKDMVIVADRGYMDFELLKHWDSMKAHFVVRHASTISYRSIQEWELPENCPDHILKDETIAKTGLKVCDMFFWSNLNVKGALNRLRRNEEAPTWEVPCNAPQEFLDMLDSEYRTMDHGRWIWQQIGTRPNHYLDCEAMSVCDAIMLKLVGGESVAEEEKLSNSA